jgi:hypothetical protein
MPLINRPPASMPKKAVTIRMPEDIIDSLHEYARFLGSSLDHIVIEALKLVFKRDQEFKAWQDQQRTSLPSASAPADSSTPVPPSLFAERGAMAGTTREEQRIAVRMDALQCEPSCSRSAQGKS